MWLLEQPAWKREKTALLEALLMYTRDLGVPITISMSSAEGRSDGVPPQTQEAQIQDAKNRCESGAFLVLWWTGDKTSPSLSIYECEDAHLSEAPLIPVDDLALATQALALKLRGLLAQLPEIPLLPPPPSPEDKPPPPRSVGLQAEAVAVPSPRAWEFGVGFALLAASADSGLRPGVTMRVGRLFSAHDLSLEIDATLSQAVTYDAIGYQASVQDWPFGLAVSFRSLSGSWVLAGGPRASLHYIAAQGSYADGRAGKSPGLALGLGAIGRVHYRIWGPLAAGLTLSAELLIPRQHYSLDYKHGIDIGMSQLSLTAGVAFSF